MCAGSNYFHTVPERNVNGQFIRRTLGEVPEWEYGGKRLHRLANNRGSLRTKISATNSQQLKVQVLSSPFCQNWHCDSGETLPGDDSQSKERQTQRIVLGNGLIAVRRGGHMRV